MRCAVRAMEEAEALYRGPVRDSLSPANTLRLRAVIDPSEAPWRETKHAYQRAAQETGSDLQAAFDECDRQIAGSNSGD